VAKRAELPKANDVLIGRTHTKKGEKIEPSKHLKNDTSKDVKMKSVQISVHLSPKALKMIETAKYKLFTEYDIKVTRSKIIETIIKNTVTDKKKLIDLLR